MANLEFEFNTKHGVWVNRILHSYSSPATSVNTECATQPSPSSSTNHRISTQNKEQRPRTRGTGTGLNTRTRNVAHRTHLNRVNAIHVNPPAVNKGKGSSSAENEGKCLMYNILQYHCSILFIKSLAKKPVKFTGILMRRVIRS